MITNKLDDLFFSVNDIYSQWDDGKMDFDEAEQILMRVCKNFIAQQPSPKIQDSGSKVLTHDIKFDDVDSMVLWLLENDIDNIPVTLRIHLEQS